MQGSPSISRSLQAAALHREVESLRRKNDALVAEKAALRREVESLRRENACVTPSPDSESDLD